VGRCSPALAWPYYEVVITGDGGELLRTLQTLAAPHVVVRSAPSDGRPPTAQACRFGVCNLPTASSAELRKQVLEGWKV